MDVTDEFDEIGVFLAENRLIAVLEELTVTVISLCLNRNGNGQRTQEKAGRDCSPSLPAILPLWIKLRLIQRNRPQVIFSLL